MFGLEEALAGLKAGLWKFLRLVLSANRDFPYHDAFTADNQTVSTSYIVGTNNVNAHGSQHKLFVSKSTLILSTEATHVHFNHASNVLQPILANQWYEFKHNIWMVSFPIPGAGQHLYLSFEGVLPEETRSAE